MSIDTYFYQGVGHAYTSNKIECIKAVRTGGAGLGLRDAKNLVEALPNGVELTRTQAAALNWWFHEADLNAAVVIRERDEPGNWADKF